MPNTQHGPNRIGEILSNAKTVFFIGIGGVSMCSLAQITQTDGIQVRGSDRVESARTRRLTELGAEIYIGHNPNSVLGADAVVYTVAIGEDNPEYATAKKEGIPLISRADYLGYLMMRYPTRIGVAGMNGKSTTTAMCAQVLMGKDPTVLCGAEAESLGGDACLIGKGRETLVFEACEYMDSFLHFNPTVAVILNIGMDHVDYFCSLEQIRASFLRYAQRVGETGVAVVNADDSQVRLAMADFKGKTVTFGRSLKAEFRAENITSENGRRSFDFCRNGKKLCRLRLCQPGDFQIENALAAATAAYICGVSPDEIARRIATFVGVHRRMEYKGRLNGADVYDDYAHHPSAVEATLKGAREMGYRRVVCAYQPHTYSRTVGLFHEFVEAFEDADLVLFADIYAAREQNDGGVSSALLAQSIGKKAVNCGDLTTLAETLEREAKEGDLIIIMGAGDIEKVFSKLSLNAPSLLK